MVSCAVITCSSRSATDSKKTTGVTFHSFPSDPERLKVWINFVNRKNWTPGKSSVLCSKHFPEEHIDRTSLSSVRLRPFAVPISLHCTRKRKSINKMEEIDVCDNSAKNSSDLRQMEPIVKKMRSNILTQCLPVTNIQDLNSVIEEPPRWVNRVEPLARRSQFVVQNSISDCHSEANRFIPRHKLDARTLPKTLVCHDYKGGYQADKYLHFAHEKIPGNGYTFYNWAQIDIFVYFSHHLITIPPLCWINMGHSNGVKVLGTLITEFDPGSELCDKQFFANMETMRAFAGSLAEVTRIFHFDGWLLNIENKVDNIDILKEFVPYLTQLLHENNPENLVIWYDSVTVEGGLHWQNELNDNNRYFFDNCDGIFLNYAWTENHLINTVEAAKHRHLDVFVGIDVFGRNMYGGGKFNTFKAAELVTKYNLSMALFAPGWTHETLAKTDAFFEQFLNKDSAFWCSLWPYLYSHPITSSFITNFYIGLDKTCYNIIGQQQQLSIFLHPKNITAIQEYSTIPTLNRRCGCIQGAIVGSRNSCLITRHNLKKNLDYIHHLFVCDMEIVNNTVVYFMTKSLDANLVTLTITLLISCSNHSLRKIRLLGQKKEEPIDNASLLEVNQCGAVDIIDSIKNRHHKLIAEESWTLNAYIFNTNRCVVLEIGATLDNGDSILLGAFGIQSADGNFLKNSHGIASSS